MMVVMLGLGVSFLWMVSLFWMVLSDGLARRIKDSLVKRHGPSTFYIGAIAFYLSPLLLLNGLPRGDVQMIAAGASGWIALGSVAFRAAVKVSRQDRAGSESR